MRRTVSIPCLLPCALLVVLPILPLQGPLAASVAPTAPGLYLPRTGQTLCFDHLGAAVACVGTGQDGEIQAGVPWPASRFIDNLDGTVTDALTGLMWLGDANCIATQYPAFDNQNVAGDGAVSWQSSLDFVNGVNDGTYPACGAGYTDWRLANVNELHSLFHLGDPDPELWLASQGFDNVMSGGYMGYWTSTTSMSDLNQAYIQLMDIGEVAPVPKAGVPAVHHFVWPVRTSHQGPAPVWQTGQVGCFDASGASILCSGTGQDGELRAGVAWPAPRLTVIYCDATGPCLDQGTDCDGNDSTDLVVDSLTHLVWTRDANPRSSFIQWQGALDYVAATLNDGSGLCGFHDWRLPNLKELQSLADFGRASPALPTSHPFVHLPPGGIPSYWSSTFAENGLGAAAWWFRFTPSPTISGVGTGSVAYVWPVRGALLIFRDGFESGNTSAWSGTHP